MKRSNVLRLVVLLGCVVCYSVPTVADDASVTAPGIFLTQAAPLTAEEIVTYSDAQDVAEANQVLTTTGGDDGVSGLEVLGILCLVGLGVSLLVAAAASA